MNRQFHLNFPPFSHDFLKRGMFFQMFKSYPTPAPSMRVRINPGHWWLNNEAFIDWDGGFSPIFKSPNNNAYWALLVLNPSNNQPKIVYGNASSEPKPPHCPTEHLPIAWVYLEDTTTIITRKHLFDARPFFASHRHFDARDFIEHAGTGIHLFKFTDQNKAKFYSIVPGENVFLQLINEDELRLDISADIGFESVCLLDMGYFVDVPPCSPSP